MVLVSSPQTHHTCTHIPQWYESTLIRLTDASASSSQKRKPENPRGSSMKMTCTVTHRGTHTRAGQDAHKQHTHTHTRTHTKNFTKGLSPRVWCVVCNACVPLDFFQLTRVQLGFSCVTQKHSKAARKATQKHVFLAVATQVLG